MEFFYRLEVFLKSAQKRIHELKQIDNKQQIVFKGKIQYQSLYIIIGNNKQKS